MRTINISYNLSTENLDCQIIKELTNLFKKKEIWILLENVSKDKIVRVDNEFDMPLKINFQNIDKIFLLHDITSYEQSMKIEEEIKREFSK